MLIYLLSKPDHWRVLPAHLINYRDLRRDGVYGLLKELERAGYVQKRQARNNAGRIVGTDWCVFDEPQPVAPRPEIPYPGEPHPVNPPLLNTEISTKTDINKHTYTDRTLQESDDSVESAQQCVCIDVSVSGESQAEEKAEASESTVASCSPPEEGGDPQPTEVVDPSRPLVTGKPSASLTTTVLPPVAGTPETLVSMEPARKDTPPAPPPASPLRPETTPAPGDALRLHAPPPAQEAPLAATPAPSDPIRFRRRLPVSPPLDAHEQEALAWAAGHSFWHSRITNPENLRRNFQEGKAFRLQFLDARSAKALASGTSTDQGLDDLGENHTTYQGDYHAESDRYFQSSSATGGSELFHLGGGARAVASERPRKLCPADAARLAEQRLWQRLEREQAERARTIDGCRLPAGGPEAVYHRPPVAADGGGLRPSVEF